MTMFKNKSKTFLTRVPYILPISQLYILFDWITESSMPDLSLENKGRVDGVLCAVLSLLEEIPKSLPEF